MIGISLSATGLTLSPGKGVGANVLRSRVDGQPLTSRVNGQYLQSRAV